MSNNWPQFLQWEGELTWKEKPQIRLSTRFPSLPPACNEPPCEFPTLLSFVPGGGHKC